MLTQVDTNRLPFNELNHEDGQANGDAFDKVAEKRVIVRRLLNRLDIAQVAALLEVSVDEVKRIAADGDAARRLDYTSRGQL